MPFCHYCKKYFFDINTYKNMNLLYTKIIYNNIYPYKYIKNIICCKSCKKYNNFHHYPNPTLCYICFYHFPSKSKYNHHICKFK